MISNLHSAYNTALSFQITDDIKVADITTLVYEYISTFPDHTNEDISTISKDILLRGVILVPLAFTASIAATIAAVIIRAVCTLLVSKYHYIVFCALLTFGPGLYKEYTKSSDDLSYVEKAKLVFLSCFTIAKSHIEYIKTRACLVRSDHSTEDSFGQDEHEYAAQPKASDMIRSPILRAAYSPTGYEIDPRT